MVRNTLKPMLVTGSSGLVGSEAVTYFERKGWFVHGIDNNTRYRLFGADGDTSWNLTRLREQTTSFRHHSLDIRDRDRIYELFKRVRPHAVIHCAAQPSHEFAATRPTEDFEINAVGTLNLLEASRHYCRDAPFVFMSTNKVYGDAPNEVPVVEFATRWDYENPDELYGISEDCRIDSSLHSPFGASKASADLMVQEFGRYYGMPTVCFRSGCLTGPYHAGSEYHGFLAYMARCFREGRKYRIYGYKGKQVRDNLHARDVCSAIHLFCKRPKSGAVYNLGGGRENSISVLEALQRFSELFEQTIDTEYVESNRIGDHVCYITDFRRFCMDYPSWSVGISLDDIFNQFVHPGHQIA